MLSDQDIIERIQAGEERRDLDYKEDIDLSSGNKKAKVKIVKHVVAMANAGGGVIVGGVRETDTGFVLDGMPSDSRRQFDSTPLNDFVAGYCDPSINTTTRIIELKGKHFGIIIVPGFREQPHIITDNYPNILRKGDILVRSASNNTRRARPEELNEMLNHALQHRTKMFGGMLRKVLASRKPILTEQPQEVSTPFDLESYLETYRGFRIFEIEPEQNLSLAHPMKLPNAMAESVIKNKHGLNSFPCSDPYHGTERRLSQGVAFVEEHTGVMQHLAFSYLDITGFVFCAENLQEDNQKSELPEKRLGVLACARMILGGVLFAVRYYRALDHQSRVTVRFRVESTTPRRLVMDSRHLGFLRQTAMNSMDVPIVVERNINLSDDRAALETTAQNMLREFCWFFYLDMSEKDAKNIIKRVIENVLALPAESA